MDGLVLVRYSLKRPLCDAAKAMDFLVIYPCIGKPPIKKVDVQTEFCQIVLHVLDTIICFRIFPFALFNLIYGTKVAGTSSFVVWRFT